MTISKNSGAKPAMYHLSPSSNFIKVDHLEALEQQISQQSPDQIHQYLILEAQLDQRVYTEVLQGFPKNTEVYAICPQGFQNEAWYHAYQQKKAIKQIQVHIFHPIAFDLSSILFGPVLQSALCFFEKSFSDQALLKASPPKQAAFIQHQHGIVLNIEFEKHSLLINTTAISPQEEAKIQWTHLYFPNQGPSIEHFEFKLNSPTSSFELEQEQSFYIPHHQGHEAVALQEAQFLSFNTHDNYHLYVALCQWIHQTKVSGKSSFHANAQLHPSVYLHPTVEVSGAVEIGANTKIWHFSKLLGPVSIGENCSFGQNVVIEKGVKIGRNVKVQNNVSIYAGVILEDDVFCGPSMVFTNVGTPRSHYPRRNEYATTLVKRGASIGANATIVCGNTLGKYVFVGAGAVVTKDIPDYALVYGNPAKIQGWSCFCGLRLNLGVDPNLSEQCQCEGCGRKYYREGLAVTEGSPT
jgi:UDP-2-acetamido-3-amino-2,3-dideoxy-glucuronate N-acetyltransferase